MPKGAGHLLAELVEDEGGLQEPDRPAGAGSALIGVLMFAVGTFGSAIVGAAHDTSGRWMAGVFLTLNSSMTGSDN